MVNYTYADLFADSVDKQMRIEFDGGTITNEELYGENFELEESLCSENQLRFGYCEASMIKFRVANIFVSLKNKWLTVSETLDGNTDEPFLFGRYKVQSDKPSADRNYRDVVAYDALHDILHADVAEWYNSLSFPMTLKQFRDSFFSYIGVTQNDLEDGLINDDMTVEKTVDPDQLSGKTVVTAICEINGCFGHIGRDGMFCYIFLPEEIHGLYPSNDLYPSDNLYPLEYAENSLRVHKGRYQSCDYEDYLCKRITQLEIRQEENSAGVLAGEDGNTYVIADNFLVYGKSGSDLSTVAEKLLTVISRVAEYRPFEVSAHGSPVWEVGDGIRVAARKELIESYILKRTLKGIQRLQDDYSASGEEFYSDDVNTISASIIQLKGKTNTLTRTVEETRSIIADVESELSTQILQTADSVSIEAQRAKDAEAQLELQADTIRLSVTDLKNDTEGSLTTLSDQIRLKVSSSDLISEINMSDEAIELSSGRLIITAGNFTLDEYGNICATGGRIGDFVIDGGALDSGAGMRIYYNGVHADFLEVKTVSLKPNDSGDFTVVTYADAHIYGTYNIEIDNPVKVNNQITANSATIGGTSFSSLLSRVEAIEDNLTTTSGGQTFTISVAALRDAIIDLEERVSELESMLSGGSWTYLQLEGYDGDEYAYSYFTK